MNISENIKQLTINGITKVQNLAEKELRPSQRILIISGDREIIEEEDLRVSFIQSVENLSSILYAFFDKRMEDYYSKNIIYLNGWFSEILKVVDDEYFKEVHKNAPEKAEKGCLSKSDVMLSLQIKRAKLLFNELMVFIQRNDLLRDAPKTSEVKKHEQ